MTILSPENTWTTLNIQKYKSAIQKDKILNWSQENIHESYVLQKFQEVQNDYQCLKFLWGHVPVKYDQMFFDRLKQIVPNDSVEQDKLQSILPVWQKVVAILAQ